MAWYSVDIKKIVDERQARRVGKSIKKITSKIADQAYQNILPEGIDINKGTVKRMILSQLSLIKVKGNPYSIMEGEVTAGLFDLCMKSAGSAVGGCDPDLLRSVLYAPWASMVKTSIDLHDCRVFVKSLNKLTGKKFMIPTEEEWLGAFRAVGNELFGDKWEWTEWGLTKKINTDSRFNILRSLGCVDRELEYPDVSYDCIALRLIEYKYFRPLSSLLRFCVNFKSLLKFKEGSLERI